MIDIFFKIGDNIHAISAKEAVVKEADYLRAVLLDDTNISVYLPSGQLITYNPESDIMQKFFKTFYDSNEFKSDKEENGNPRLLRTKGTKY